MADQEPVNQESSNQASKPLEYEETPIIEPIPENPPMPEPQFQPEQVAKQGTGILATIILLIILFVAGIGLSFFLKQFLPNGISLVPIQNRLPASQPTPTSTVINPGSPYADWKTYQVLSGVTKQAIGGISFMLPTDVAAPICDGGNCASQGTYLPGGTRFTVAPRGPGQLLPDYRGKIVSDLAGQSFTVKTASVAGLPAVDFSGLFTGTTNGGYAFSQMHGLMVNVADTLSLEINHFTPNGVTADFAADDDLFIKILGSLSFLSNAGKGAVIPLPSQSLTSTPTTLLSPTPYPTPTPMSP